MLQQLSESQIEDLRLAATYLTGVKRRAFQAEMTLKYCNGSARQAESKFGWNRRSVSVGLAEKRTGIVYQGAQSSLQRQQALGRAPAIGGSGAQTTG